MSAFDQLDPLVQHHIVNTLGWRELRPLQEASIEPVLRGDHCLLLAPTAGGKTESVMFPALSRMCQSRWESPSLLYICPLKALINNLGERLEKYTSMLGRRCAIWHGDVTGSRKQKVRKDPPDVILTTPESLESMLISGNAEMRNHLRSIQMVVIDEIHAFAGDDRGWHLLAVIERLQRLTGRSIQRIGLSATVGNPDFLLDWLAGNETGARQVVLETGEKLEDPEIVLDFVGSLENAATIISRLHRGEKRLVFCDSRSRVEKLASLLRNAGVDTFVSHSSLSASERKRSEEAFATGDNCVIVATSTLELGIDVGDLDRVIQIDSPTRVASFLQRLGRTGRRAGVRRNCLFLTTTQASFLQAAAILNLWSRGFVEPITPPSLPFHIIAQQALAMCLERGGVVRVDLSESLKRLPLANAMTGHDVEELLNHIIAARLLETDGVRCFMGEEGESSFGWRYFTELLSVFTSSPMLDVTDGRQSLGMVDQSVFTLASSGAEQVLSLGGRGWIVRHVDWRQRSVLVAPTEQQGKTNWLGGSCGLSSTVAAEVKHVLLQEDEPIGLSARGREELAGLRNEFAFLKPKGTTFTQDPGEGYVWHTYCGRAANQALTASLVSRGVSVERCDDFTIALGGSADRQQIETVLAQLTAALVIESIEVDDEAREQLKFSICVPDQMLHRQISARACTADEIRDVLESPVIFTET